MTSSEEQRLFDEIVKTGCCQRCALRYLGYCKTVITFEHPETCLANFGFLQPTGEPATKMHRDNPCSVCLNLLGDEILEKMLEHENIMKLNEYLITTFVAYITFPTCILLRDHSMKLHLKKLFPNTFDVNKVIKINNAWRYSIEDRLCQKLNKSYDHLSKLTVHFYTEYELGDEELQVVQEHVNRQLSKHTLAAILGSIPDEKFSDLVQIPPKVPLYEVTIKDLKYYSESIHLVGKYCKYSRTLPQSSAAYCDVPTEESIEKIIADNSKSILCDFKKVVFKASSFDDTDIRVLGQGRTFHLEIIDPKFGRVTFNDCKKIEEEIKKTGAMEVKNLQEADRRDIKVVLDSERVGTRLYKVLCLVKECKNINYCINAINMLRNVTIQQKTPIRLIQTDIKNKRRQIFYIKGTKVEGKENYVELEICTECGFHIPEFVNGDFSRTKPSLGDIMKALVECLAIDIIDFCPTLPWEVETELSP